MPTQPHSSTKFFALSHLAVITVSGQDSAKFLQGQLTCDINSLTNSKASVAAFCNPKGRVISTLLVLKTAEGFLLILPASLQEKVCKKLQMYILRSQVQLNTAQQVWRLFGLQHALAAVAEPLELVDDEAGLLKLSWWFGRELCLAEQAAIPANEQFLSASAEEWRFLDISAGFPWFEAEQSELYIPQMLNIDGLGGVSFNKGCYTGQEIIARTHYLGAAKRHLYIAECAEEVQVSEQSLAVIDAVTRQSFGAVLQAQCFLQQSRLLLVLSGDDLGSRQLLLDDGKQTAIKISAT